MLHSKKWSMKIWNIIESEKQSLTCMHDTEPKPPDEHMLCIHIKTGS